MQSAVARGWVNHRRFSPRAHAFRYGLSMLYLDLDEAPTLFSGRWLWSYGRHNLACVLRRDHLRGGDADLASEARNRIQAHCGERPSGRIGLLTQPRYLGYNMNPISLYLVWSADGERLEWLILEVHNTPWDEQHPYILQAPAEQQHGISVDFDKAMHVSPFMPMDMRYRLQLRLSRDRQLALAIDNWRDGQRVFAANMHLKFQPATATNLARVLIQTPLMTFKVAAGIYFEALRLKLKGVPYVPHPKHAATSHSGASS